jgi:hypothetical protein
VDGLIDLIDLYQGAMKFSLSKMISGGEMSGRCNNPFFPITPTDYSAIPNREPVYCKRSFQFELA